MERGTEGGREDQHSIRDPNLRTCNIYIYKLLEFSLILWKGSVVLFPNLANIFKLKKTKQNSGSTVHRC